MDGRVQLSNKFKARVAESGLTPEGLAGALGITVSQYSEFESGALAPTVELMAAAVRAGLAENFGDVAEVTFERRSFVTPAAA